MASRSVTKPVKPSSDELRRESFKVETDPKVHLWHVISSPHAKNTVVAAIFENRQQPPPVARNGYEELCVTIGSGCKSNMQRQFSLWPLQRSSLCGAGRFTSLGLVVV